VFSWFFVEPILLWAGLFSERQGSLCKSVVMGRGGFKAYALGVSGSSIFFVLVC